MKMIRFESNAGAPVTMHEDLALMFIRMTGHQDTVPGAIVAEDIPQALSRLRQRVAEAAQNPDTSGVPEDELEDDEAPVKLPTRAFPLVKLLEAAERQHKDLLWDRFDGVYI